jgi:GNAT superfamily N-acetyltransferase
MHPHTMHVPFADLPLARRLETTEGHGNAAFIDAQARREPYTGAMRTTIAGTLVMFAGVGSPITQTFCLGIHERPADRDFDAIERFFTSRGSAVFHEVSPHAGIEVCAALAARLYKPVELSNVMYQPIDPPSRPETAPAWSRRRSRDHSRAEADASTGLDVNRQLRVRTVDVTEADWYGSVAARGWSEMPEVLPFIQGFARSSVEVATCFVAELDGQAIATAALFMHEGVALLAGASTVPEGRRNGAQVALLDARLRLAVSRGCDLAMMVAAPGSASQRNAERNGFRVAYTRTKWQL